MSGRPAHVHRSLDAHGNLSVSALGVDHRPFEERLATLTWYFPPTASTQAAKPMPSRLTAKAGVTT